jgi:hypothetical protein
MSSHALVSASMVNSACTRWDNLPLPLLLQLT